MNMLTVAQKAAYFDALVAEGTIDTSRFLTDMSSTLERVIEAELTEFREPVWTNKVTGHRASSVCAAFRVLGFSLPYGQWADVVFAARKLPSYHARFDLPKENPRFPTVCLDLRDIEALALKLRPRKGKKVIAAFKEEHGVTA